MGIYHAGFVIFVLCLILLIYNREWFFYLSIFFIPFSNTAVLNVGANSISLPFLLVVVSFIYYMLRIAFRLGIGYNKSAKWAYLHVFLVFMVVNLSALMPFYIDGDLLVLDRYNYLVTYAPPIPLKPSMQYITQLIYFQVGLWFATYLMGEITTMAKWLRVVKFLLASGVFISLWGLFEFSSYYIGVEFPVFLFSNLGLNQDGINFLRGMPRISSATLEPSVFAQTFSFIIPLFALLRAKGYVFFSKHKDTFVLVLFLIAFALSNSSTAYLLILFFGVQFFWDKVFGKAKLYMRVIFLTIGIILFIIILPFAIDYAISKLGDWSGRERTLAVVTGIQYFLEYPILGVGWGVWPVWDVLVCIACQAGIIGLVIFMIFFKKIYTKMGEIKQQGISSVQAVSYAALAFLLSNQVSGFLYYTQYVWMYLGIVLSFIIINQNKLHEENKNINNNCHL